MKKNDFMRSLRMIISFVLAAALLCGSLPMTVNAASDQKLKVAGLTLVGKPDADSYYEGDEIDLTGLEIEITYVSVPDVEKYGERAPLYTENIAHEGDNYEFYSDLAPYGISCNYLNGRKQIIAMLEHNYTPITFRYGPKGEERLETDVCFDVLPIMGDKCALAANELSGDGEYLIVADDRYLLTSYMNPVDFSGEDYLTICTTAVEVGDGVIPDVMDQLRSGEYGDEIGWTDVLWYADDPEMSDGGYQVKWCNYHNRYIDSVVLDDCDMNGEWPLYITSASDAGVWHLDYTEDSYMYLIKTKDIVSDSDYSDIESDIEIVYYTAVDAVDGYAYLTTDRSKAASISVYRIEDNTINSIEISSLPDKMEYTDGEAFDHSGMVVDLKHDDRVVFTVPSELFDAYGIDVYPDSGMLKVSDDGANIRVSYGEYHAVADAPVRVKESSIPDSGFDIVQGKLRDGNHLIMWFDDSYGDMESGLIYCGFALSSRIYETVRGECRSSTFRAASLSSTGVGVVDGSVVNPAISNDLLWTVRFDSAVRAYTIQHAVTGEYLALESLTGDDLWAWGINPSTSHAGDIMSTTYRLMLSEEISEGAYWLIDGTSDAGIRSYSAGDDERYITLIECASGYAFGAYDYNGVDEPAPEKFAFFSIPDGAIEATGIEFPYERLTLPKGEQAILDVTVYPVGCTDVVQWSSSDKSVATVENGVVTAVGPGTATITASLNNGKITAECEITVYRSASGVVAGDSDGDGKVGMRDSTILRRWLAGWEGVTIDEAAADVTGDGIVTMLDSTVLRRYLAGWSGVELK